MDGKTAITLAEWLRWPGPSRHTTLSQSGGIIGIHDVRDIDHDRAWLWALLDYRVTSVSADVIWLAPREAGAE